MVYNVPCYRKSYVANPSRNSYYTTKGHKVFAIGFIPFCLVLDARTNGWFLMNTPWPVLTLSAAYLLMCFLGPKLMVNRKPLDLKNFIILYNFALVLLSLYMFVEVCNYT